MTRISTNPAHASENVLVWESRCDMCSSPFSYKKNVTVVTSISSTTPHSTLEWLDSVIPWELVEAIQFVYMFQK